jgi:hypothetical protein
MAGKASQPVVFKPFIADGCCSFREVSVPENKSAGGIVLPAKGTTDSDRANPRADPTALHYGIVVECGPLADKDGKAIPGATGFPVPAGWMIEFSPLAPFTSCDGLKSIECRTIKRAWPPGQFPFEPRKAT